MDTLQLQHHFRDTRVISTDGRERLAIDDSTFDLAITHWSTTPEASIATLTRHDAGGLARTVFFRASDFEARTGELAVAIAGAPGTAWIGNAHEHHARLVELGQSAQRMAMIIALRRWRGAVVEGGAVRDGAVALEFQARPDATLTILGRLGSDVLFTVACPLALAPAYACRAVAALGSGEVLAPPEALEAQREAQAAIVAVLGLAPQRERCDACAETVP